MAGKHEYRVTKDNLLVIDENGNFRPNSIWGKTIFVDYRNGADTSTGLTKSSALKTLSAAYAKVTTNNLDFVVIDGDSEIAETTQIAWSKNRATVYGVGGGLWAGQGARLSLGTAAAVVDSTLKVSGVRNVFANMKISNAGTDAASIAALVDAGEFSHYVNCSIMKTTDHDQATVADVEARGDSTSWLDCEFGTESATAVQSVARPTMRLKASGAVIFKHNKFKDCNYTCTSSSADKAFILVDSAASVAYDNIWKDCTFVAAISAGAGAITLDNAVDSCSGLIGGNLIFVGCATNCTAFNTTVKDNVKVLSYATNGSSGIAGAGT